MTGKTCVITGASSGIGRATAAGLAAMGATVVLVCRDLLRGETAVREIRNATLSDRVHLKVADLSCQRQVRQLAKDLKDQYPRINVLVNNAAVVPGKRQETKDGIEMQFAVNHLAPFLLTNLLQDTLVGATPSRVVTVSSTMHRGAQINWDDLQFEHGYTAIKAYGQSKLANVMFANEFARRMQGTGVVSNSLHPGGVRTGIMRNLGVPMRALMKVGGALLLSPEKGAKTSLYVATSTETGDTTGAYFDKCKSVPPSDEATDPEAARRLWEISEELTGLAA